MLLRLVRRPAHLTANGHRMPLIAKLAFRNLFHDPLRLIATMIGIVFSIVLVTVQMGLYFGFGHMVASMIDIVIMVRLIGAPEGEAVLIRNSL